MLNKYLLIITLVFSNCQPIKEYFIDKVATPDPCDPTYNMYDEQHHFIHGDFLTEDGIIDQRKWWFYGISLQSSPCNPIKKAKPSVVTKP